MRTAMLAAMAMCGLATGARAATITLLADLGPIDPYYFETQVRTLPAFNPNLGTLNSTALKIDFLLRENVTAPLPGPATVIVRGTATVGGFIGSVITQQAPDQTLIIPVQPIGRVYVSTNLTFNIALPPSSDVTPADVRAIAFAASVNGRNVQENEYSDAGTGVFATVVYDYTPVPEPASLGLLGMGLVAAVTRRRAA